MSYPQLIIEPTTEDVVVAMANWLSARAQEAISDHGVFLLALSGGSTPRQLYAYLSEHQALIDWSRTAVFFSDERDVPPTHPESNFGMANNAMIKHLTPPPQAVHRWHTEYEPSMALADYRAALTQNSMVLSPPVLDVILLGLGPEGHTASLFPDQPVLAETDIVAHVYVPTHSSWRYSFTLPLINHSKHTAFLVTGPSKQDILYQILAEHEAVPAARISPRDGEVHWFLDQQSAQKLPGKFSSD